MTIHTAFFLGVIAGIAVTVSAFGIIWLVGLNKRLKHEKERTEWLNKQKVL